MSHPHPTLDRAFDAFLFDMDGTLLSSILAAERAWSAWAQRHGLDVTDFLPSIHGLRTAEAMRLLNAPGHDPEVEAAAIVVAEMEDMEGVAEIAGAAVFLASLPADRWAIVTSAPRALALRRLAAAGLPLPALIVTSEDVQHGKPAPDCFLLAARRMGVKIENCLVFEDAPAGIAAAEAAGAPVMVINATHRHPYETHHPQVSGYDQLAWQPTPAGGLQIGLHD